MTLSDRIVGLLFFVGGLIFVVGGLGAYRYDTYIQMHGERSNGTITRKVMLFAPDGDSDFRVDYTFPLKGGKVMSGSHLINKELYDQLKQGSDVEICYHPNDLKRNFPVGTGVTSLGLIIFSSAMGLIFLVFGLMIAFARSIDPSQNKDSQFG